MSVPLLVTAALIVDNGKILLVKRAREPFKDYWGFVSGCGAFEYHSNPSDAVKKEVQCDLSCDFSPTFFTYREL
jgi:ADP-ribose pyrophosphatase YjhB (NUDIX family)